MLSPSGDFNGNLKICSSNGLAPKYSNKKIMKTKQRAIKKINPKNAAAGRSECSLFESTAAKPSPGTLWFCSVCRFPVFLYIDPLLLLLISQHLQQSRCMFIYTCVWACMCTYSLQIWLHKTKKWIWPTLSDSNNTLFLFNTKIWAVLLLLLSHAMSLSALSHECCSLPWLCSPNQCYFKRHNTAQED